MKKGWKGGISVNSFETIELGVEIANFLEKGDVLSLTGELASGKTTFVKGILKGLRYKEEVTSPTFTLINEYNASSPVIHIDAYREDNLNRWVNIGFHDYLNEDNIVIIEWADKITSLLISLSVNAEHVCVLYLFIVLVLFLLN